jgi:hypothetical protein
MPVAVSTGIIATAAYGGTSAVNYLQGTDPDAADTPSTLQIFILSIPSSRGTLVANGVTITSSMLPYSATNNVSFVVMGNNNPGTDQFTFRVQDDILFSYLFLISQRSNLNLF